MCGYCWFANHLFITCSLVQGGRAGGMDYALLIHDIPLRNIVEPLIIQRSSMVFFGVPGPGK